MARKSDRFGERGSKPLRAKDDDDKVSVLIAEGRREKKKMSEDYLLSNSPIGFVRTNEKYEEE